MTANVGKLLYMMIFEGQKNKYFNYFVTVSVSSDKSARSHERNSNEKSSDNGFSDKLMRIFSGEKSASSSIEKKSSSSSSDERVKAPSLEKTVSQERINKNLVVSSGRNSAENSDRSLSHSSLERKSQPEPSTISSDKKVEKEIWGGPSEPALRVTSLSDSKINKINESNGKKEKSFFDDREYVFENSFLNKSSLSNSSSNINDESILKYKDMKFTVLTKAEKEDYWKKFDPDEFDFNIKPKKRNKFLAYFCGDFCE
jgi:hypothetical protein